MDMRKLIAALGVGGLASLGLLFLGVDQPGRWVAVVAGLSVRQHDIFIHDLYLIYWPAALAINAVVFGLAAFAIMRLGSSSRRGHGAGA